jgi:hypothetical protein
VNKSELKIACVGNMNNSMFAIVRHLRHRGYNAHLILSEEFSHFQPEADTFEKDQSNFTFEFDFLRSDILFTDKLSVNKFFSKYNFIIACGYSVAYLTFSKVKIDIVIPYGSDLYDLPFFVPKSTDSVNFNKQMSAVAKYQKIGIENASAVIFDHTNDDFEKIIAQFNFKGTRYKYPFPFIFTPEFSWENSSYLQSKSVFTNRMTEIRKEFDFIAFNHIRQSWKNPQDLWSYKGNERIFRAFKKFIDSTKAKACLVVFEYGIDVEDSKRLVNELGIQKNIVWFPITKRREILSMISFADVGIGEIGDYSWFSYGAIFEFMCMKKPIIHHRNDAIYKGKVESLYPMYCATSEDELVKALIDCYKDKNKATVIANEAYDWYIKNAINKPIEILTSVMDSKKPLIDKVRNILNKFLLSAEALVFYIKLKFA